MRPGELSLEGSADPRFRAAWTLSRADLFHANVREGAALRARCAGQLSAHLAGKSGAGGPEFVPLARAVVAAGLRFHDGQVCAKCVTGPQAARAACRGRACHPRRQAGGHSPCRGQSLAACSSSGDTGLSFFADPGKYQFHTCAQIADAMKGQLQHVQDLKTLIDRAEQSAGGAAVGFIAYKADYVAASEEEPDLRCARLPAARARDQDATLAQQHRHPVRIAFGADHSRAFSGNARPCGGRVDAGFPARPCKNVRAVSLSGWCETALNPVSGRTANRNARSAARRP